MSQTAALPVVWVTLRVAVIINWVLGALLLGLLFVSFQHETWLWHALGVAGIADRPGGAAGMRAVIAVGILSVPLTSLVLLALVRIVETVRARDPFIRDNAERIRLIAWTLLALQVLHIGVTAIGAAISTGHTHLRLGSGSGLTGWLAILLLFVLASVFREGAAMRDDLEGTV